MRIDEHAEHILMQDTASMTPVCLTMIHDPFKQTLLDRMMCPRTAKVFDCGCSAVVF